MAGIIDQLYRQLRQVFLKSAAVSRTVSSDFLLLGMQHHRAVHPNCLVVDQTDEICKRSPIVWKFVGMMFAGRMAA